LTTASAENEVTGGDAVADVGVSVGLTDGSTVVVLVEQAVMTKIAITAGIDFRILIFATYSLRDQKSNLLLLLLHST
jgi:hypothetical protein